MSYPASIDSIPQPTATSPTNNPSAAGVSVAQTTAIIALETKVGTGASTPTAGDVLTSTSNGTSVWAATGTGNVSNSGTPTNGQIAQWTGATVIQGLSTTGSGNVVLATSPTLVAPALGTPASGVATNLTGTASGLTAGNVTTNANLTGPITSSGNATSIASQTGTGSKFVVDTSPTIVTPTIVENANPVMSLDGNPVWQFLGLSSVNSGSFSTTSSTAVLITGMTVSVTIPSGASQVRVKAYMPACYTSGSNSVDFYIYSGSSVSGGTKLQNTHFGTSYATVPFMMLAEYYDTSPTAGSVEYFAAVDINGGSTFYLNPSGTVVCYIEVECC